MKEKLDDTFLLAHGWATAEWSKKTSVFIVFLIYFLSLYGPNRAKSNVLYNLNLTEGL